MNGPHDLGGMQTLGAVNPVPEKEDTVFHDEWEKRAFAFTVASGRLGLWSIDGGRYARERQHPVEYLRNTYYENWMAGLITNLKEAGLLTEEELQSGKSAGPAPQEIQARRLAAADVAAALAKGNSAFCKADRPARFKVGDRVRVMNLNPTAHCRAPRYLRGHVGVIESLYGDHVFPDRSAGGDHVGDPLYCVRFDGTEIWGPQARNQSVHADLWDSYLDPA